MNTKLRRHLCEIKLRRAKELLIDAQAMDNGELSDELTEAVSSISVAQEKLLEIEEQADEQQ